mmetsp:Transcript_9405/g.8907  ORF Transcript_9405/g.8907 Transcript_9405/m.8907 type:complete len:154 (+) Transcript_9405:250-711(+)
MEALTEPVDTGGNGPTDIYHRPIFRLLKAFKLQQYAMRMAEMGFGEDIYKLALLSHRQKEELIEKMYLLPGHKSKLQEFFKVIEHLYPRTAIAKTIESAQKESQIQELKNYKQRKQVQSQSRLVPQKPKIKNLSPTDNCRPNHFERSNSKKGR